MKRRITLSGLVLTFLCIVFMSNVAFAEITPEEIALNSYIDVDMEVPHGEDVVKSYKIIIPTTGTLVVYGNLNDDFRTGIYLYDSDNQLLISDNSFWKDNNILNMKNISMPIQLTKGEYYLSIINDFYSEHKLVGNLHIKFTTSKVANYNSNLKGKLYRNESLTYQVKLPYTGYFYIKGSFVAHDRQGIQILDSEGQVVDEDANGWSDCDWYDNNVTGLVDLKFKTNTLKAGTYYVKINNGNSGDLSYNMTLRTFMPATSLKVNTTSIILKKGTSYQLKAIMGPGKTTDKLTWSSANKRIATVSNNGKVIAKSKGTVYIKVKTTSGLVKLVKVIVR